MTQKEVIAKVAENNNISPAKAEQVLKSFFQITKTVVTNGGKITIKNFGSFYLHHKEEGQGWNPALQRLDTRPAKDFAKFKPSAKFLGQ